MLLLFAMVIILNVCTGVSSLVKNKKVPSRQLKKDIIITSIKLITLSIVGFNIFFWFGWIVIFDSAGSLSAKITSILLSCIGAISLFWIWIISEEYELMEGFVLLKSITKRTQLLIYRILQIANK